MLGAAGVGVIVCCVEDPVIRRPPFFVALRLLGSRRCGGSPRFELSALTRDEAGGITIFVLILFILLLVVVGMAVDFQRQEMARADLQNALDRGVLAAANRNQVYDEAGPLTVDEQARAVIVDYMASRTRPAEGDPRLAAQVMARPGGREVLASAQYPLDTIFLRMMGLETLDVVVQAGAVHALPSLEIVLVLDISGSMGRSSTSAPGTKLDQLKVAAREFLDIVLTADTAGQTLISIVPFSQQVNLPRWMADMYDIDRQHDYASCIDFHSIDFSTTAMPLDPGPPYQQAQHFIEYNGRFACPAAASAVTPFSNDLAALKGAIDRLVTENYTATYLGMKWGAALLDPSSRPIVSAMVADGRLPTAFANWPRDWNDPSVRKIVVLMSDGRNTRLDEIYEDVYRRRSVEYWNRYAPRWGEKYAVIDNDRGGEGDVLLRRICDQVKLGTNTTVYTIGFELAGEPVAEAALRDCATALTTFYLVDGIEIATAFRNIADEIVNLKLVN